MLRRPAAWPRFASLLFGLVAASGAVSACRGPARPATAVVVDAAAPPAAKLAPPAIPADWAYPVDGQSSTTAYASSGAPVAVEQALVTSDAALATQVGVAVLRAGGNAVDAAVAVAFALAVVYPEAGNLGGGGFAVVRMAAGEATALDFRETAPAAATKDMYLERDEPGAGKGPGKAAARQPADGPSVTGALAVGVPGTVAGLWALHAKYGVRPWQELLAPAVKLARDGFVIDEHIAWTLAQHTERLARFPASAALFLPGGKPLAQGTTWKNPELAAALERIAAKGAAGFYEGVTAAAIVAEMKRGKGLITASDLKGYKAVWRDPIRFAYRGREVLSMPPPSSGGVALAITAALLESYDLEQLGWHTAAHLHLLAEVFRRAYAERNARLGDPDGAALPVAAMMAPAHVATLGKTIDLAHSTPSAQVVSGPIEGENTTHVGVVDAQGNAVALTYTLNALYGSAVTVTGGGFLLNDEMDDFTTVLGKPNEYGLVQGAQNQVAPGRRMLSSMAPTIVVDADGKALAIFGARGGSRIITAVFQELSNVIDFGMSVEAAVRAPRIHHQHEPDVLFFEATGLGPEQRAALEAMGHTVKESPLPMMPVGSAPAIVRQGTRWTAAPDPRRGGAAAGF